MCCVNNELTADPCMKYTNGTLCKSLQKNKCRNSDVLQSMGTMVRNGTDKGGEGHHCSTFGASVPTQILGHGAVSSPVASWRYTFCL